MLVSSEYLRDCVSVQGAVRFSVSATAGTRLLGTSIPLEQIANICKKHSLCLHLYMSPPVSVFPCVTVSLSISEILNKHFIINTTALL